MPRKPSSLPKKVLFALAVTLGFLLLLECGARLFWTPPDHGEATALDAHPTRGWTLQDKASSAGVSFRLGAHGLREVPRTGAPHHILTTGDSSIFGHGLPDADTLHIRLHTALQGRNHHVDVLTAGVPGYTTAQTLDQMRAFGWAMAPQLLVVGNLWSDSNFDNEADTPIAPHHTGNHLPGQIEAPPPPNRPPPPSQSGFWMKNSRAVQMLDAILRPSTPKTIDWITPDAPGGARRVPITDYAKNLDTLFSQAAERKIGALFLLPCNRELAAEIPTPPKGWPWDVYFETAQSVATAREVPIVNGCEIAKAKNLQGDAAFLDEMHPTAALNTAYAEAIADTLITLGWPSNPLLPKQNAADLAVPPDPWAKP